jgi:nucleotide-binding universal stress UspA family protein
VYRNILLPLSLAPEPERVFETALRLVEPEGGRLVLLHVIERIRGLSEGEMEEFYSALRKRAEVSLSEWKGSLESRGAVVESELRMGRRGATIVECAFDHGCDLILLASRAADPERLGRSLGSTSHLVALAAPCSVLLVR